MKTIWKYTIKYSHAFELITTPTARVVFFSVQGGQPTFWMEFQLGVQNTHKRQFQIFGTGHDIPDHARYIGTTLDGPFVWHLYEVTQ